MEIKDLRELIFENYYKQICFFKKDSYCTLKKVKKDLMLFATNEKNT